MVRPLDIADFQLNLSQILRQTRPQIINPQQWNLAIGPSVRHLYFYPKYRCTKRTSVEQTLLPTMLFAAETNRTLNTGFVARGQADCLSINEEINRAFLSQSVFMFSLADFPSKELLEILLAASGNFYCHEFQFTFLCRPTPISNHSNTIFTQKIPINPKIFSTSANAIFENDTARTNGVGGFLIFGPYQALPKGKYQVKLFGKGSAVAGAIFDVVSQNGNISHGENTTLSPTVNEAPLTSINFTLETLVQQIEFRLAVHEYHSLTITRLELSYEPI